MLRFINICLVLGLVALAYVIYEVKYEARGLDGEIAQLRESIDAERDAVAVLRAEWSLLNRPERIERLAEKHLKLKPARPGQLVTLETLQDNDFELAALVAREEATKPAAKPVAAKAVPAKPFLAKAEGTAKPAAAAPAPAQAAWSTTTVTAEAVPEPAPAEEPKAKAPILATSAFPVSVSMPGR